MVGTILKNMMNGAGLPSNSGISGSPKQSSRFLCITSPEELTLLPYGIEAYDMYGRYMDLNQSAFYVDGNYGLKSNTNFSRHRSQF